MIQDIAPYKFHNEFRPGMTLQPEDHVILYRDGAFVVSMQPGTGMTFPSGADLKSRTIESDYLFEIDGEHYFGITLSRKKDLRSVLAEDWKYELCSLQEIRRTGKEPKHHMFALFTAYHLMEWYDQNRFCGCCGGKMRRDTKERAMVCPACDRKVYPRINPAVIIGVINGNRLLLTRYRNGYGMNALVAGFTEIGETFEETVAREVMEETGLRVKNIRYYKSQPWGIASDILAGYYCEVDGSDVIRMDTSELKYAEWVERDKIELQPQPYSLTNEMMVAFKAGLITAMNP